MAKLAAAILATAAFEAQGVISRKVNSESIVDGSGTTKMLAGVRVENYHLRSATRKDEREHWVVVARGEAHSQHLQELCHRTKLCERTGDPDRGGMPFFEVFASEDELEEAFGKTDKDDILFAEPDGVAEAVPELEEQQVVYNGVAPDTSWGLDKVGAKQHSGTGKGTHIYVIDTGIRTTHDDFGGRAVPSFDTTSGKLQQCTTADKSCSYDRRGHGTHTAGTAGGRHYGVAPGARLHAGKVLSDQGKGKWSWIYQGLDYVSSRGQRPAVATMSLSGLGKYKAMKSAVDIATRAGVSVVVAAGNMRSDSCEFTPAYIPNAISVGSVTSANKRSIFSNQGVCTSIWAPGSFITSASVLHDLGGYTLSGTSMAAPHVAGAIALILEKDVTASAQKVRQKLMDNAKRGQVSGLIPEEDTNAFLWVGDKTR